MEWSASKRKVEWEWNEDHDFFILLNRAQKVLNDFIDSKLFLATESNVRAQALTTKQLKSFFGTCEPMQEDTTRETKTNRQVDY